MKSPFKNARVVGPCYSRDYVKQEFKRGDARYVMSRSELKNFAACPDRWRKGYKQAESDSLSWGDKLDCLVFTPELFPRRFVVAPATYPAKANTKKDAPIVQKKWNRNADYCRDWEASQPGEVITQSEADNLTAAKTVLFQDSRIADLLEHSQFQVLIEADYVDAETGLEIPIKGLIDILPSAQSEWGGCLADLKTCASGQHKPFRSDTAKFGYHMQAALYLDIYNAATGDKRKEFRHVLQENFPPFQTGRRFLSTEFIKLGRIHYESALALYCQCLTSGEWPDYETGNGVIDGWTITEPEAWMVEQGWALTTSDL